MKTLIASTALRVILFSFVWLLMTLVFESNSSFAQDYKVGDKITVMDAGNFIEVAVTKVDDRFLSYNVERAGRTVEERSPIGMVESWKSMADGDTGGGDFSVDSRTQVGFRTTNGVMRFATRTWAKKSGEEFRAKLKVLDSSTFLVQLVKEDGTELEIDLNDLDEIDNNYMRKLAENVKRVEERGSSGGRGGSRFGSERGGNRGGRGGRDMGSDDGGFGSDGFAAERSAAAKYKTTKLNTEDVKKFKVTTDFSPSIPSWQPTKVRNVSIPFDFAGEGSVLHVSMSGPVLSSDGKYAAIGLSNGITNNSKVVVFDLARGKIHAQKSVSSSDMTPIAFSPDNTALVTANSFRIEHRILFWTVDPNVGELTFKKAWDVDSMVKMGTYLDADRLAMATSLQVVVFEPKKNQAVSATSGSEMFSVAGGGGYTIDSSVDGHYVVDIANGTRSKFSDVNQRYFGNQSINANGRLFATIRTGVTKIFDLTNGKVLLEMSGFGGGGNPKFVGSRFVIVGNYMYDMRLQAAVAKFQLENKMAFRPTATSDGTLLYAYQPSREEKRYVFVIADLLTAELGEKIAAFTSGDPTKIGPGTSIAVNSRMKNQKIPGELKKYFTDAGLKISPNANLVVEAEVERLDSVTVNTGEAGKVDRQITTVTYTPTISHLRLKVGGETIYSRQQENNPGSMIRRNQGESVQAAARRMSNPNVKFFTGGGIPTKLNLYPGEMPVIGVNESGLMVK